MALRKLARTTQLSSGSAESVVCSTGVWICSFSKLSMSHRSHLLLARTVLQQMRLIGARTPLAVRLSGILNAKYIDPVFKSGWIIADFG